MTQTSNGQGRARDWRVFDDWDLPLIEDQPPSDWNAFDDMLSAYSSVLQVFHSQLNEFLNKWDRLLSVEFGGDPTHRDWRQFRPLRLSREEDWSDWLAYLIEHSDTGIFSCCLFDKSMANRSNYARPKKVEREVGEEYRADVIVQWANETFTHIEVKVGDPNLSKTIPTSRAMWKRYGQPQEGWTNYILLLSWQIPEWEEVKEKFAQHEHGEPQVDGFAWDDVCVALRRGLQSNENIQWKAYAYSMVGAIEQMLIGYPGYMHGQRPTDSIEAKTQILRKGLEHE